MSEEHVEETETKPKDCWRCGGRGSVPGSRSCHICNGTGYAMVPPPAQQHNLTLEGKRDWSLTDVHLTAWQIKWLIAAVILPCCLYPVGGLMPALLSLVFLFIVYHIIPKPEE